MFERFAAPARQAVVRAVQEARHREDALITEEHLLLALAHDGSTPAGRVLAQHEITRADIETAYADARRRGGLSEADTAALRELGIDVSDVVEGVEKSLGTGALAKKPGKRRWFSLFPQHIPFADESKQLLERTLHETLDLRERAIRDEHMLLAITSRTSVGSEVLAARGLHYTGLRAQLRAAG